MKHQKLDYFLKQTLKLAQKGKYFVSPNPMVGCVIVNAQNEVVATGYHRQFKYEHAEVNALKKLNFKAKNTTLYVNLEPCCHTGNQPPCTDAIIQSCVKKVVILNLDPNPKISGKGIEQLKKNKIEVEFYQNSDLINQGLYLNRKFFYAQKHKIPWLSVKSACSLDGKIAMSSGESQWITSHKARELGHQLRAENQAILTSAQTVIQDNANLNVRLPHLVKSNRFKQPIRIVLDRELKLNKNINFFQKSGKIIVVHEKHKPKEKEFKGEAFEVEYLAVLNIRNLENILSLLYNQWGIISILVEAGSKIQTSFLKARLINEWGLFMASSFLGNNTKSVLDFSIDKLCQRYDFDIHNIKQIDKQNFFINLLAEYEQTTN